MNHMNTGTGIAVALAVVVALSFLFLGSSIFTPFSQEAVPTDADTTTQTNENFMITDTVVGSGAEAVAGSTVTVHYTGTFENGEVFDSSVTRGEPISFVLGSGFVIPGWDQGLLGMKEGGKRHLVIPPELAYGPNDYRGIPGGSTLIFDVELIKVEAAQ